MKNFTFFRYEYIVTLLLFFTSIISFSQTTSVQVSVDWPRWASENRVDVYSPGGTLLTRIGYVGSGNNSHSETVDLGCLPSANNYYFVMYDTSSDGWDGPDNITITTAGTPVINQNGNSANIGGFTAYFNVFGGDCASCSSTVSTFPYTEGFESGTGAWTQDTSDNFDWTRQNGGTPSDDTGPSGANEGSRYMFTEASGNYRNTANLQSPCFNLTGLTNPEFSFWYHMYGADMGTLRIYISTNSGATYNAVPLWTQTGQVQTSNGASWNQVKLNLSSYIGQTIILRIQGVTGNFYRSDMAIDDISLTNLVPQPEINITGLGNSISDGDTTPSLTDNTDFGDVDVISGSQANTFVIENLGTLNLNLTGTPRVLIGGANAGDFTVTNPATPIAPGGTRTFVITFNPSAVGLRTANVTIANNDSNENPYNFNIQGNGFDLCGSTVNSFPYTEGFESGTGAWTQDTSDNFDWTRQNGGTPSDDTGPSGANEGSRYMFTEASGNFGNTANLHSPCFNLTGLTNPEFSFWYHMYGVDMGTLRIYISTNRGATYNAVPLWTQTGQVQTSNGASWNQVKLNLSSYIGQTIKLRIQGVTGGGYRSDMSIDDVSLINAIPQPEINITGLGNTITDGDITPIASDNTLYGSTGSGSPISHIFNIQNTGSLPLTIGAITFVGANPGDFSIPGGFGPAASIPPGGNSNFTVNFNPTGNGTRSAIIRIVNNDANENPYDFTLQGTGIVALTEGPGGVTNNLNLWLKGTDGLGYTDGQRVSLWADQGRGQNATAPTNQVRPYYRDNATSNVNFNPVVDFDNSYNPVPIDNDYSYDNPNTQFLQGTGGFYSQDIFVVIIPDVTINNNFGSMDVFCGDERPGTDETDATGIGFGNYSQRFNNEVISYAVGTTGGSGVGYGVAQTGNGISYNNAGIINTRNNSASNRQELYYNALNKENTQSDTGDFSNVSNSRYWIGRSEGWEASTDARIAEIITYSTRKSDNNLTQERNRIMSYLAIKYGITLGNNGTSQDYVNSSGQVIWDQSANTGFNFDIAGIGRDNQSDLNQKQSRSVNNASDGTGRTQGIITMGLSDIYATNNLNKTNNPTNFADRQFLVWGNNGANLNSSATTISVNMSSGISPALTTNVSFTAMARIWKVVENGGDIPKVKISIPQNAIRNINPPGSFYMFISTDSAFGPTADYRLMTPDGNGNLVTEYDFDNTKYITFGYAPQTIVERSIYFTGLNLITGRGDYIDMENKLNLNPSQFTVSAWIKRDLLSTNTSILSKRDNPFTKGYDFRINVLGQVEMTWKNGGTRTIVSTTTIPANKWHQVAVIYSSGTAKLYIDGVLDKTTALSAPVADTESFYIGAAGKNNPTDFFRGNIDEVRVWNVALSVDQLRYIMNQEIVANGLQVSGKKLPVTLTRNEVASIPWSQLAGYYPMSVYTFTNTEDASGNGNQGALRNLNTVDRQTAPLPYTSSSTGDWNVANTWRNSSVQDLPNSLSIVDGTPINWNIVETAHNIRIRRDDVLGRQRAVLGLSINSNTITVEGSNAGSGTGNALTVTHYLKLNGNIDLNGESQLIQTLGSDLDVTSSGRLDRDQQGSADAFTYNYWSSPVGTANTTSNNNNYNLSTVKRDGTNSTSPTAITFVGGYNGTAGSPIGIAHYWIWKYANQPDNTYSAWQQVRNTGTLRAGEGYTMKGPGTGAVTAKQNYVLTGKPNNGNINLTLSAGNDYLVGNPYASAIRADQFINDNGPVINGTLYFWEHWGGGSHLLKEYEGGYAMYNLSGGAIAATIDSGLGNSNPAVTNGTKLPTPFIPIGQGFFVVAQNGGQINFNNGQRVYRKEGTGSSVFLRNGSESKTVASENGTDSDDGKYEDNRMKFRLGLESVNNVRRQLLLTIDEHTTDGYDWGYDGPLYETQSDDMYWMIDNEKYVIQGRNSITESTVIPLGLHTDDAGQNMIKIDTLENMPDDLEIYLHDKVLNIYQDLRLGHYDVNLPAGEYLERFEVVFSTETTLSTPDNVIDDLDVYYANETESIVLLNPTFKNIKSIEMFNLLGQSIKTFNDNEETEQSEYKVKDLSTGTYIIKLYTDNGVVSKKVLVK